MALIAVLASGTLEAQDATATRVRNLNAARALNLNNALLRLHGEMQRATPSEAADLRSRAATAIERRAATLSTLIRQDPQQAPSLMFSPDLLSDLAAKFPESASLLESHGTWQGPIERWIMDYADGTHQDVNRMRVGDDSLEVHFAGPEPAGLKSGDILTVTGVRLGADVAVTEAATRGGYNDRDAATVQGSTLEAALGSSERRRLQSGGVLQPAGDRTGYTFAASSSAEALATTATSAPTCSTTGVQNTAVLIVTFPGVTLPSNINQPNVHDMFFSTTGQSLDGFWREASYGQTSAAGDVFGPFTLDSSYQNCLRLDLLRDAAVAAATTNAGANFQNYQRIFVVLPDMCGWTGLALSGCTSLTSPTGPYTASTAFLNGRWQRSQGEGAQNASHEGGHTLGLAHANSRDFGTEALGPLGVAGTVGEYGDHFSTMGLDAYPFNFGHYAASQKAEVLNWLASGTNYQVVTSSGTYTLQPYEISPPGLNALKIQRGTGSNAWLWVEYRQPVGNYDPALCAAACQPFSGALIHYEDSITGNQSHLLDFTPSTDSWDDPALLVGQTWVDAYTNLSITVQTATASGLTVNVNYGTTPCTHANPTVTVSPSNPSVSAGASANYTVSVTNNDAAGCSSSTFNMSSSQPSGWPTAFSATSVTLSPGQAASVPMTKTVPAGATPGTDPVDASAANGIFVGSGAANCTVTAPPSLSATVSVPGTTYTARQTVYMTAIVLNGGIPVSGASVTFTMTEANGTKSTKTATTDSTGKAVWSYRIASKDPKGTWSVTASTSYGSQTTTSNSASFTVQ